MEASHRCVHGNSYSFYPSPRAYGNEYELVWWFDSTLCYLCVSVYTPSEVYEEGDIHEHFKS